MESYLVTLTWLEQHTEQVPTGAGCGLGAAIAAVDSMRESGLQRVQVVCRMAPWRLRGSRVWAAVPLSALIAGGDQDGLEGAN